MRIERNGSHGNRRVSAAECGGLAADELGDLDFLGDAEFFEQPDAVVVGVELVPGEAVAAGGGMGVMVVVPSFAAGEQSDPPGVAGVVLGVETAGSRSEEHTSELQAPRQLL